MEIKLNSSHSHEGWAFVPLLDYLGDNNEEVYEERLVRTNQLIVTHRINLFVIVWPRR